MVTVFACDFTATIGGVVIVCVGVLFVDLELSVDNVLLVTGLDTFDSVDTTDAAMVVDEGIVGFATVALTLAVLEPPPSDFSTDVADVEGEFELETGTGADFLA